MNYLEVAVPAAGVPEAEAAEVPLNRNTVISVLQFSELMGAKLIGMRRL